MTATPQRPRRRLARFNLPPLELVPPGPIHDGLELIDRLVREGNDIRRRLAELQQEERRAEQADLDDEANWIRGGRGGEEPERDRAEKVRAQITAAEREGEATAIAISDAIRDLEAVLAEHAPAWARALEAEVAELRAAASDALAVFARSVDELEVRQGLLAWAADWHGRRRDVSGNRGPIRTFRRGGLSARYERGDRIPAGRVVELATLLLEDVRTPPVSDDGVHFVDRDGAEED